MKEISSLLVKEIFSDPTFNCRGSIAPIDVVDLAKDIDRNGQLEPIIVTPYDNAKYKYKVIAGHRRLKAHEVLKFEYIDCIVREDIDEDKALLINLTENIQRKDLNILQEARALAKLKEKGFSIEAVSMALGKSATWVRIRYELLELPEEIQQASAAGFIKQNQIRDLYRIKDHKEQMHVAAQIKKAKERGESVPVIRKPKRNIHKAKVRDANEVKIMMEHIQKSIGNNFGTRCLAWASGNISDYQLFSDINEISAKAGLHYTFPTETSGL